MTEVLETAAPKEKLAADLKKVIADAEELLVVTAQQTEDKVADLRARLITNVAVAREKLVEVDAAVRAKTKEAAQATDAYVHENPWKAIGIAAGAGLLIGMLIGRR